MIDKTIEKATPQPLGLTVHSLPAPTEDRTKNGRWKMLMVLLLCASPVIASYITYYIIRPEGRRKHSLVNGYWSVSLVELVKLPVKNTCICNANCVKR
jgi:hypothetical protein